MSVSDKVEGGSAQLITELAKTCYAPLMRYAQSLAKNETLARDAVQESFLKLLNESKRTTIEFPKAWLFRVCRNKIFDELKRGRRYSDIEECFASESVQTSEIPPNKSAEMSDNLERVRVLSQNLTVREREAIRLKFQCGFSYSQIAQIMSVSESNVGVILHKAVKNLRSMFFEGARKNLNHS